MIGFGLEKRLSSILNIRLSNLFKLIIFKAENEGDVRFSQGGFLLPPCAVYEMKAPSMV